MKTKLLFTLLFGFSSLLALSQNGEYFLTHYAHKSESIDHINFDIEQDEQGVISIANRIGIIRFDGKNWEHINTPGAIFSLSYDKPSNTLYTGGFSGLGHLIKDKHGNFLYQNLTDSAHQIGEIFSTEILNQTLYGLSHQAIISYNLKTGEFKIIKSNYSGELYQLHIIDSALYVATQNSGLQLVGADALESTKQKSFDLLNVQFTAKHPTENKYLVGLTNNTLKIYDNGSLQNVNITDEDSYLVNSDVVGGIWLNDTLSVLASLKGGVIFINHRRNTIQQIVNYQSGLPDNEILAFSKDTSGGIWLAHSAGFTRISPYLPFRSFTNYQGLEGQILSVTNHNDSLYVGTSLGLFYLQKVKNFEEIEYLEKSKVKTEAPIQNQPSAQNKRKGLFGFLKSTPKESTEESSEETYKTIYRAKTKMELKSIRYEFVRIEGLNSKVQHFISYNNKLYCGGLDGLFEIAKLKAKPILAEPIQTFTIAKKVNKILASTYDNKVKTFNLNANYSEIDFFGDFNSQIQHIVEDRTGKIWLCSNEAIYSAVIEDNQIMASDILALNNPYYYRTLGMSDDKGVFFVNESGLYQLGEANELMIKNDHKITKYINGSNGNVWMFDNNWSLINENHKSDEINLLGVFKNITYIATDNQSNQWVVTENNELYKVSKQAAPQAHFYNLFLKRIKTTDQSILPQNGMKFSQENSALLFEFAQPEFSGIMDIKYQFKLNGLTEEWSEWSDKYNIINFPYLPEGDYTLKMRSKNILGVITEIEPFNFEIVPPYWKQPWFYAFEFTAMAMLLFLSVRLRKAGFKYQWVSKILALITLVIIIEFIQTVAENQVVEYSTPVLDFLIQVTIAIFILPIESLARKYIITGKNEKKQSIKLFKY